jgi:hypothetical protein
MVCLIELSNFLYVIKMLCIILLFVCYGVWTEVEIKWRGEFCVLYAVLTPSNRNEQPIGARNNVLIRGNAVLYGAINAF